MEPNKDKSSLTELTNVSEDPRDFSKMFTMEMQTITEEDDCYACIFCKSSRVDEIKFGPMYYRDGVVTHYYCMLFSAALSQFGEDHEGILGFLPNDIMKEVRRSYRLRCVYCNIVGASVGCCNKKCRHVFHFPCGLKNGSNFQFYGNYESFCPQHFKRQKISIKHKEWTCPICIALVLKEQNPVMSSCCKAAVFHKECMQRMALNAGYFFKCPTCNAGSKFVQEMRSLGIFVPEQDASWEKDNAFHDLYVQYSKCDAEKCECGKGREYISPKGSWMLARCRLCGASGTHRQCSNLDTISNWACKPCLRVEKKGEDGKQKEPKLKKAKVPTHSASNSRAQDIDSDHVSARSGNRRVRNGNHRAKRQLRPVSAKDEDEDFDLSKVKISQSCFSYFPYTEEVLRDYGKETTLPDWRKLNLSVNVMKWVPQTVQANPSPQTSEGRSVAVSGLNKIHTNWVKPRSKAKPKLRGKALNTSILRESLSSGNRRKRKRIGRWNRGVLGKRGKNSKRRKVDSNEEKIQASIILGSNVEKHAEFAADHHLLSEITQEVEEEIIPVSAQEKAESLFFSAIEIEDKKLPLQHIPLVRRRKQVFPSDPNRKYFEVNGNILEVNYSTSCSDNKDERFTSLSEYDECSGATDEDSLCYPNSNPSLLLAGQVLKMNVVYDVEISYDGEQIRIDESENSCSPSRKLCSSNWKPISKYVTNTIRKPDTSSIIPLINSRPVTDHLKTENPDNIETSGTVNSVSIFESVKREPSTPTEDLISSPVETTIDEQLTDYLTSV